MGLVLAQRTVLPDEKGTHLFELDIYRPIGNKRTDGMVRVRLFVSMHNDQTGTVVGGCKTGTETFRVGKFFTLKPTGRADYPYMLCL